MSLRSRLVHRLALVSPTTTGVDDDYGQPIQGVPTTTLLRGFVYPLTRATAREERQPDQAGAMVVDHAIVIEPREVPNAGWFRFDPDDGVRYHIVGVEPHRYGTTPLVQVLTRRIRSEALPEAVAS